jgi:transcriptional regulator with XRE-family HTH domain
MAMTLKALRVTKGLEQKTAADALGITPDTLRNWEKGATYPNAQQISKIEDLYSVSYADINFCPNNSV